MTQFSFPRILDSGRLAALRSHFASRTTAALVLVALVFVFRGPYRALRASDLNDLISPYAQATAWLHGADPYSPYSLFEFWPSQALSSRPAEQEFFNGTVLVEHGIPTAYPLTCFVLLAPFAL